MPRKHGQILKPLIRKPDDDGCWQWLGKINKRTGYGHKQWQGSTVLAHRWVFQLFNGWIPEEMVINHKCSNRWCVKPDHLEVVTTAGNCRHGRGSKLTAAQASEIKRLISVARWGDRRKIAIAFGVSDSLISDIKYGRAWSDIP